MTGFALRGYYAILDLGEARALTAAGEADLLERARQMLAAGPCCMQLRAKKLSAAALRAAALLVRPLCRAAQVPLCVNDRADVAVAVEADAVHVGQEDLSVAKVRAMTTGAPGRPPMVIGVSTHSLAQARAAVAAGADYLGFGPIFATTSKADPDPVVGIDGLRAVCAAVEIPVVAIGGITRQAVAEVAAAGASAAAVISDIERALDRTAAGRQVAAAFDRATAGRQVAATIG